MMDTAMAFFRPCLFLLCISMILQFHSTNGGGRLYFGFTEYNNQDNRRMDGNCCDGQDNENGHCPLSCDLIFQVSISGLDGPNTANRRPSEVPFNFSVQPQLPFPTDERNFINPLSFTFHHWPDCMDVVVEIYDLDDSDGEALDINKGKNESKVLQLVDKMTLRMAPSAPSAFFAQKVLTGQRLINPSNLTVVSRYECDNDTMDTTCPLVSSNNATPNHTTINNISSASAKKNNTILDCPTTHPTTVNPSQTTVTNITSGTIMLSKTSSSQSSTVVSTPSLISSTDLKTSQTTTVDFPQSESPSGSSNLIPSSTLKPVASTPATQTLPTTLIVSTSSGDMTSQRQLMSSTTTSLPDTTSSLSHVTTKESGNESMDYWKIILGCLLGIAVIVALFGFIIFYRRRQAAQKRQEIYTVNPRIVSELTENGTAGRGDIPLETAEL